MNDKDLLLLFQIVILIHIALSLTLFPLQDHRNRTWSTKIGTELTVCAWSRTLGAQRSIKIKPRFTSKALIVPSSITILTALIAWSAVSCGLVQIGPLATAPLKDAIGTRVADWIVGSLGQKEPFIIKL